jgi:hypothetical protein
MWRQLHIAGDEGRKVMVNLNCVRRIEPLPGGGARLVFSAERNPHNGSLIDSDVLEVTESVESILAEQGPA